jgi:hypothetical protein
MPTRQQALRSIVAFATMCAFVASMSPVLHAQDERRPSPLTNAIKQTLLDPTTYVPGILSYDATMRDWKTSQPFFQHGFVEQNSRFTVSGLPGDTAIDYGAGRHLIIRDALGTVALTAVQNLATRLVEDSLANRYPEHRKLLRGLGWAERIAVASFLSYQLSAAHYRQAAQNQELASQLGLH